MFPKRVGNCRKSLERRQNSNVLRIPRRPATMATSMEHGLDSRRSRIARASSGEAAWLPVPKADMGSKTTSPMPFQNACHPTITYLHGKHSVSIIHYHDFKNFQLAKLHDFKNFQLAKIHDFKNFQLAKIHDFKNFERRILHDFKNFAK